MARAVMSRVIEYESLVVGSFAWTRVDQAAPREVIVLGKKEADGTIVGICPAQPGDDGAVEMVMTRGIEVPESAATHGVMMSFAADEDFRTKPKANWPAKRSGWFNADVERITGLYGTYDIKAMIKRVPPELMVPSDVFSIGGGSSVADGEAVRRLEAQVAQLMSERDERQGKVRGPAGLSSETADGSPRTVKPRGKEEADLFGRENRSDLAGLLREVGPPGLDLLGGGRTGHQQVRFTPMGFPPPGLSPPSRESRETPARPEQPPSLRPGDPGWAPQSWGSGQERGTSGLAPGARGLWALEQARARFRTDPLSKYEHLRHRVTTAMRTRGGDPTAIEAYFEAFVKPQDGTTTYFLTLFAEIISALESHNPSRALGVASAGVHFLEQRVYDGDSNLDVAWLATMLEDPVMPPGTGGATGTSTVTKGGKGQARSRGASRRSFAQTVEPEVLTAVCAALKDWEGLDRLRRGLAAEPEAQ